MVDETSPKQTVLVILTLFSIGLLCIGVLRLLQSETLAKKALPYIPSVVSVSTQSSTQRIPINTASRQEIDGLSGLGAVRTTKILSTRPFQDLADMKEKTGIPNAVLQEIEHAISF